MSADKVLALSNLAHLVLHVVADGEQCLLQLPVVDLSQKVRLVLHWVRTGAEPEKALPLLLLCIMPGGNEVVVVAALLVESTKLNETVAHHVGVGRQSCAYLIYSIARHLVPVFPVAVNHLKPAAVLRRYSCGHLQILLTGTVPLFPFLWSYIDIEAVRMQTLTHQFVDHYRRVDTTRQQHRYTLVFQFLYVHGCKVNKKS